MRNLFYSWQSDLPNNSNRTFINDALEIALRELKKEETIVINPVVDRDTQGISGSPDIENSILSKIDNSFAFVADVSITNKMFEEYIQKSFWKKFGYRFLYFFADNTLKPSPNPNVLVELGYAIKCLGLDKIIMLQNSFFGGPEVLPFDLRGKRVITYNIDPNTSNKASEKKILISKLKGALKPLIENLQDEIEIETKLILCSSLNNNFSIDCIMPSKLHSTWSMELIFNMLKVSLENHPEASQRRVISQVLKDYRILDITNKIWINPQTAYELDKKIIAFVPIIFKGFMEFDDKANAKAISLVLEANLK